MLNFQNCFWCINDFVINDSVYARRYIVFCDSFLKGNINSFYSNIHFCHGLEDWNDESPSWLHFFGVFSELEFYTALVFIDLADADEDDE